MNKMKFTRKGKQMISEFYCIGSEEIHDRRKYAKVKGIKVMSQEEFDREIFDLEPAIFHCSLGKRRHFHLSQERKESHPRRVVTLLRLKARPLIPKRDH